MRNNFLLVLLTISVGANAWLFFGRPRFEKRPSTQPALSSSSRSTAAKPPAAARTDQNALTTEAAGTAPFVWRKSGASEAELRTLAAELRAAGFPPEIIVRFIGEMLRERTFAEVAQLPYWQLIAPSRATRQLQASAARELLRLQEEILGPAGSAVATLDPLQRRHEYGTLGDAKVAALLRIDRDYDELRSDLAGPQSVSSREEMESRGKAYEELERERIADVAAALSSEEFADWERRKSPAAERTGFALRDSTITEDEYLALFAAEKMRNPYQRAPVSSFGPAKPEQLAYLDQVRSALGDERASSYLRSADFAYGLAARAAEKLPGMSATKTFELYKLQNEAQAATLSVSRAAAREPEKLQATMADLNARLEALLGAEAAAAYRAQATGSIFNAFRTPPPVPGTPPKG
ncbi:MAG: hypothetical protein C0518_03745 [Opitutus sp.]|nr:hypothetical protein [Opitutus sp.]